MADKTTNMNAIIALLQQDFKGSTDYHSGVNDGMYHLLRWLKGEYPSEFFIEEYKDMNMYDRVQVLLDNDNAQFLIPPGKDA